MNVDVNVNLNTAFGSVALDSLSDVAFTSRARTENLNTRENVDAIAFVDANASASRTDDVFTGRAL